MVRQTPFWDQSITKQIGNTAGFPFQICVQKNNQYEAPVRLDTFLRSKYLEIVRIFQPLVAIEFFTPANNAMNLVDARFQHYTSTNIVLIIVLPLCVPFNVGHNTSDIVKTQ